MRVKPVAGHRVLDPRTHLAIPEDGLNVSELDTYWVRRLRAGDVVVSEPAARAEPVKQSRATHKTEV
jgi:hypothetical protein